MDLFFLALFLFFGKERHAHIVRLPQAFYKHLIDIGLYFHLLVTCFTCFHNFTFYPKSVIRAGVSTISNDRH